MSLLYLVRHAEVAARADLAAHDWPLSPAGIEAAAALAGAPMWRSLRAIASSPEAKALATARPIADAANVSISIEPALREVDRGATPLVSRAEYDALVTAHFTSGQPGWERAPDAADRIAACIDRLAFAAPLCVVSHGLVLSHYLAHLLGRPPDLAAWRAMPMPAVAVVDLRARQLVQPFHSAVSRATSSGR